jgi:hypothetical protein
LKTWAETPDVAPAVSRAGSSAEIKNKAFLVAYFSFAIAQLA